MLKKSTDRYFTGVQLGAWAVLLFIITTHSACYTLKWNELTATEAPGPPPTEVKNIFDQYPESVMSLQANSPGYSYPYDIGEKDRHYGKDSLLMRFRKVELRLQDKMPPNKIIVDLAFIDGLGNELEIKGVDLLRLTPKLDGAGKLLYAEYLLEEYNRFGLSFRKEHNEFALTLSDNPQNRQSMRDATYRASITNNCLAPTKWEFGLTSEDYGDFSTRLKDSSNLNQNKILAHSWFYLKDELYSALLAFKNPQVLVDLTIPYDSLSLLAEEVVVDFNNLRRPLKNRVATKTLEVGHKSGRKIEPIDVEQHYKWQFGLLLDQKEQTYKTICEQPVKTTRFKDGGYYSAQTPNEYDFNWLKYLDDVEVDVIDVASSESYVQLTLDGEWAPYNITLGNIDLSLLEEQKLTGYLFGINTYPKSRRYNPAQSTTRFDAELLPDEIKPYLLMTDKKSGKWVNNQHKGVEKIYLSYESLERDVLLVYVLSYERITPLWMARVELPKDLQERVRIRKQLYSN